MRALNIPEKEIKLLFCRRHFFSDGIFLCVF